jgi:hypothetical protein
MIDGLLDWIVKMAVRQHKVDGGDLVLQKIVPVRSPAKDGMTDLAIRAAESCPLLSIRRIERFQSRLFN